MREENEIGLVDLLLVVADNLKLLILGPLLVGLLALGIAYTLPQSFTSQALLNLGDSAKSVEAMMRSPAVLDVVLKQFPSPLGITDNARAELAEKFRFGASSIDQKADAGVTKLEVEDESPARAQDLANALIDAWLPTTKPRPARARELARKLKVKQDALETASELLKRLTNETTKLNQPNMPFELGTHSAQLLQLRDGYMDVMAEMDLELRGKTRDIVVSPPSLPTDATKPKKGLIAVLAALAGGVALLLWVFVRLAWKNAAQDIVTLRKQARPRVALDKPSDLPAPK